MDLKVINSKYWEGRAEGYSLVNKEELDGVQREKWSMFLREEILGHFPDKAPQEISILDIGAGPGFLSIILAEQGFLVTAADGADNMIAQAKQNAGSLVNEISFAKADAENLHFKEQSFDVILSRNLTWNLPHPKRAYESWMKALKPGGIILIFDANWYHYLIDEEQKKAYEADRVAVKESGFDDYNIGDNFDVMEDIAEKLPMTEKIRPSWDEKVFYGLGATSVEIHENIGRRLYSKKELVNYKATPLFMVKAVMK
ncbi:MAG: class I SAM-dependent methyltransferase [Lachnospiraceae bacterium]|nr:class I SAM-dependent methyltransferase [Lachnospiraceae bacterium]